MEAWSLDSGAVGPPKMGRSVEAWPDGLPLNQRPSLLEAPLSQSRLQGTFENFKAGGIYR